MNEKSILELISSDELQNYSDDLVESDEEQIKKENKKKTQKKTTFDFTKQKSYLETIDLSQKNETIWYSTDIFQDEDFILSKTKKYPISFFVGMLTTEIDNNFLDNFLLSYKAFIEPKQLLALITARFKWSLEKKDKSAYQIRIFTFLKTYLIKYYQKDVFPEKEQFNATKNFFKKLKKTEKESSVLFVVEHILNLFTEIETKELEEKKRKNKEGRFMNRRENQSSLTLFDISSSDLADQLTRIEANNFLTIDWRDVITENKHEKWLYNRNLEKDENRISFLTKKFNSTCKWFIREIEVDSIVERRIVLIEKLIKTAYLCLQKHNHNTVMQIVLALQTEKIQTMRKTWAGVKKKSIKEFHELVLFSTPLENFREIRKRTKTIDEKTPYIPFLPFYLSNIAAIQKTISFEKKENELFPLLSINTVQYVSDLIQNAFKQQKTIWLYQIEPISRLTEYILKQT